MRLITLLAVSLTFLTCTVPVGALRADDSPWLHRFYRLHHIHRVAEAACHWSFLENRLGNDAKEELKFYCSRLEHPLEWAQDQQWWKAHLPNFMQGGETNSLYRYPQPDSEPPLWSRPNKPLIRVTPPLERYILEKKFAECDKLPPANRIRCMGGLQPPSSKQPY